MPQVYLTARSASAQNGAIQITDLFPNQSQANLVNDPKPQGPFYVRTPELGISGQYRAVLSTTNGVVFFREARGLVPYLLRNVEKNGGGALSLVQAKQAAADILTAMRFPASLNLAAINAILNDRVAGTELTDAGGSNSTGSVEDILKILSGETYIVPAGTRIETALGAFVPTLADAGMQSFSRTLVANDSSWQISLSEGSLGGLVGRGLVTVYAADGSIYAQ